jgi:hypothetical protein
MLLGVSPDYKKKGLLHIFSFLFAFSLAMDLPKSAVQVPGIKELRKQLGFPESLPRTKDLTRSIKVFRLRFTSPAGIKGSSCRDWKSEQHKEVLRCMTRAWLEDEQNGERFWPPAESPSVLQYALHPST